MSPTSAKSPSAPVAARDPDELRRLYTEMLRIRRFEESAARAYTQGKISGFLHLYIGQEAIAVATADLMKPGDRVVTTYRDHGFAVALGCETGACMAELYGKKTGLVGGNGGSMHFFAKDKGLWGGYAIVGGHVPVAAGHAYASKYKKDGAVTLCFLGEGAMHIGATHEGMHLAGLWRLPIVFVIENNQYAMGTSTKRSTKSPSYWERGASYGIPGEEVDGMDVLAVKAAGQKAVEHCRAGKGPYILEIKTYRYRGHSMSDPAKYRTREEVQKMRDERDPIEAVRSMLLTGKHASEEDLKAIDKEIKEVVNASAEFAKDSPEPALEELWTDIYADDAAPQNA